MSVADVVASEVVVGERECFAPGMGRVGRLLPGSGDGGATVVFDDGAAPVEAEGAVPLPMVGEFVQVPRAGGVVRGYWVGVVGGSPMVGGQLRVRILDGSEVTEIACTAEMVDAGRVVTEQPDPAVAGAVRALAETCRRLDRQAAEHAEWKVRLGAAACEMADRQQLCKQFDAFMDDWGLQTRTREYTVEITLGTVHVNVTAADLESAKQQVDGSDVRAACAENDPDWSVADAWEA